MDSFLIRTTERMPTKLLNRLADAEGTRADYDWVRRLCSRHSMTAQEWDRRGFNDPNITHLYPTNNEVNLHNTQALNSLDKPILRIEAKNSNAMMRKLRPDRCGGLTNVLLCCFYQTIRG